MTTETIDKLFLELSLVSKAYTTRELVMIDLLETVAAAGRPHSASTTTYPDGCECEQCEAWDRINKFCKTIPAAVEMAARMGRI